MASKTYTIPWLVDHHSHPLLYAAFRTALDLSDVGTFEQAAERISQRAATDDIVIGFGWKDNRFEFPADSADQLPAFAVFNLSLHRLVMNQAGRQLLNKRFGSDVAKIDDHDWFETNLRLVWNWFALLNGTADALVDFYEYLESIGVWSTEEMLLVDESEIGLFDETGLSERTKFWAAPDTYQQLSADARKRIHGIKLFTDGAFGSRTAAVVDPYLDAPGNRGMLMYSDSELGQAIATSCRTGKALAVHVIGDRAMEQFLMQLNQLSATDRQRFPTIRIEHAQLISRDQAEIAKRLGIVLSMQPNFTIDSVDYADRLGPERAAANNPFRMLIDQVGFEPGIDLILGSDGMPHGPEFALQQSLHPPFENQKLSLEEFIAGYCDLEQIDKQIDVRVDCQA